MILPTKRLGSDRALITLGAEILSLLTEPKTVSHLWDELGHPRGEHTTRPKVNYDWFILTLDLLYILGSIELNHGRIWRINR